jgi:hypothetical protein
MTGICYMSCLRHYNCVLCKNVHYLCAFLSSPKAAKYSCKVPRRERLPPFKYDSFSSGSGSLQKHSTVIATSSLTRNTKRNENIQDHGQEPISTICASLCIRVHHPCDYYGSSYRENCCSVHMGRPT